MAGVKGEGRESALASSRIERSIYAALMQPEEWTDKRAWSRGRLEGAGFEGWKTFGDLADRLSSVSAAGGVYVVFRDGGTPSFRAANPGGRFKNRDPSVSEEALRANWVDDASVIYIGKADDLRRRLREFMRFGSGAPIGHWGGRLIWQLSDSASLVVGWQETPEEVARDVETAMINAFRVAWGKPPFANEPHRLGS